MGVCQGGDIKCGGKEWKMRKMVTNAQARALTKAVAGATADAASDVWFGTAAHGAA